MSITGDMIIDYENSTPEEFLEFYEYQYIYDYSELEYILEKDL